MGWDGKRVHDRHHLKVTSALMDRTTLETHRDLAVPTTPRAPGALMGLTPAKLALHDALGASGDRREQERIELGCAIAALHGAMRSIRGAQACSS